jgi:hypothetical protein
MSHLAALRVALENLDAMEFNGPTTEAVIDAAQRWYLATPSPEAAPQVQPVAEVGRTHGPTPAFWIKPLIPISEFAEGTLLYAAPPQPLDVQERPELSMSMFATRADYDRAVAAQAGEVATRSQRLRAAGFTRRPSWKSLPKDGDDEPDLPEGTKLWLWKDGGRFLAFTHEYPCYTPGGDPMVLGNPTLVAEFRGSYDRTPSARDCDSTDSSRATSSEAKQLREALEKARGYFSYLHTGKGRHVTWNEALAAIDSALSGTEENDHD